MAKRYDLEELLVMQGMDPQVARRLIELDRTDPIIPLDADGEPLTAIDLANMAALWHDIQREMWRY
jgi:hypothetical protein